MQLLYQPWLIPVLLMLLQKEVAIGGDETGNFSNALFSEQASSVGFADAYGCLHLHLDLNEKVYLSPNYGFPMRIWLRTAPHLPSSGLADWRLPLLDCSVVQLSEETILALLPMGAELRLYLRKDGGSYQSKDGRWNLHYRGNNAMLTEDAGWKLVYENGRIKQLQMPNGEVCVWDFPTKNTLEIKNSDGKVILSALYDEKDKLLQSMTIGGKSFRFEYGRKAIVKSLVQSFQPTLKGIVDPNNDGVQIENEFKLTNALTEGIATILPIVNGSTIEKSSRFTWDAKTGRVMSDADGYQYTVIKELDNDYAVEVARTDNANRAEKYINDTAKRTITQIRQDGSSVSRSYVGTPGKSYNKVRTQISRDITGKEIITKLYYDENGKVIRISGGKFNLSIMYPTGLHGMDGFVTPFGLVASIVGSELKDSDGNVIGGLNAKGQLVTLKLSPSIELAVSRNSEGCATDVATRAIQESLNQITLPIQEIMNYKRP